mmetsp:Transcript_47723/g.102256  ORF Transcript_47723/g.102256 Transcript_47723/m.102256 type:complete len:365 (-) Transcript_47723:295-1389(-)|eukprot:CAMPEP_0206431678 /NCGR_PEP_ID=MMETSP0324_2-20121206/7496_1 /ASSEMBLY_ACC=CAM_ASM_000836 /TAXON_ID=2866 /ORGANISM="Crypthecodinium cohnii, Strain Seligo" /LENGTH=364 /DNA_ID=CAMNT_0053897629 /DNA_START=245 /DNA_END=1339 /DNA_ORIENTATION=+
MNRSGRAASAGALPKSTQRVDKLLQTGVPIQEWTAQDVGDWTEHMGLPQYRRSFVAMGVNGVALSRLTLDNLKDLGVRNLGHQHALLDGAAQLRDQAYQGGEQADNNNNNTGDQPPGSPAMSRTGRIARSLAKRQQELVDHAHCSKAMRDKLNDVVRSGVLTQLLDLARVLRMEESENLLLQTVENISKVRTELAEVDKSLHEKKEALIQQSKQAGIVLGGTPDQELYKTLTNPIVMPHIDVKQPLGKEDLEKLVDRLYPKPQKKEKPREAPAWQPPKPPPEYKYVPPPKKKLPEDEVREIFCKMHPDYQEELKKRQDAEADFMNLVRAAASRGTHTLDTEERKSRIDGFNERYKADLVKRGIA